MYLNSFLLVIQVYLIKQIQAYVLLTANLDDFKSIARKFVPEHLVDQLAGIAAKSPEDPKFKQASNEGESVWDTGVSDETEKAKTAEEKEALRMSKVNFEELVERVKQRLLQDKLELTSATPKVSTEIKVTRNQYGKEHISAEDNTENPTEELTKNPVRKPLKGIRKKQQRVTVKEMNSDYINHFNNAKSQVVKNSKKATIRDKDSDQYDDTPKAHGNVKLIDDVKKKPKAEIEVIDDGLPYSKVEMKKRDSYEDYVIPAKEKMIYASDADEQKERNYGAKHLTDDKRPSEVVDVIIGDEDIPLEDAHDYKEYIVNLEDEMKAKTEDIGYDYGKKETEDYDDTTTPMHVTTKKKQGTMYPKRDYYKISSPNYLAKVPVVAERYDFDEPLPEKDREPEVLERLLPIPPSVVNGKVRFSK